MLTIRDELKVIIRYEEMYYIKNKQRFSLRYYKKHPKKLESRKRKILKSLRGY
jgi:hypothetical protein